ncbi:MAG: sugar-binding protein [Salibacteraceae bacterium]
MRLKTNKRRSLTVCTWVVFTIVLLGAQFPEPAGPTLPFMIPQLQKAPSIDGNLEEWKALAFSDGAWDLDRVKASAWYQPKRNRLTLHEGEDPNSLDLKARYYMAWDRKYLYLGAEVKDNVNDVTEAKHAPKRWYYKDAIAWFLEAPLDTVAEKFGEGDHGFAFVIDTTRPDYGAWWRHGSTATNYLEEPLPVKGSDYAIVMQPTKDSPAGYVLEARIAWAATVKKGSSAWKKPKVGDRYRLMLVHCDPDGGEYGGHLLIYGQGDDDSTWTEVKLGPAKSKHL